MTFQLENVQTNEYPHFDRVWPPFEKSWLRLWLLAPYCAIRDSSQAKNKLRSNHCKKIKVLSSLESYRNSHMATRTQDWSKSLQVVTACHTTEEHVHKPGAYHQWRLLVKHNFQSSNFSGSCFLRRSGAAWRFKWKGQIEANLAEVQSASVNNWPTANDRRGAVPGLRLWTSSNCSERCKAK